MKTGVNNASILETPKKTFQKFILQVMFSGVIAIMLSCQNDNPAPATTPVTNAISPCKIQTLSISGTGRVSATVTYTYDFVFNYTYDRNGNQTGQTATYKHKYSDGKMSTTSNSTSNQFDANDYIIRQVVQSNPTNKADTVSNSSTNIEYTYADGRLIKEDHNTVDNGKLRNYIISYEYDAEGKLIKMSSTFNNSHTKYEWNGNKVQKMTNVDKHGNITSPFREYDNNGRLAKSIETSGGSRDEFRYQYDAEGQVVRYEQYINAKPSSAYATEYDNKENPLSLMYPKLKGHPSFPRGQADYEFKNNIIKAVSYTRDSATSEWKVNLSTLCTYVYNDKNLPTEVIGQSLDDKGILKDISRASYVYQDCQ